MDTCRWNQLFVPYLDSVLTMVLSIVMLSEPVNTVITGIKDLLLISPEEETVMEIKSLVEPIIVESNCSECKYDIVRTGRKFWISAYIKLDKDELSVQKFQMLQTRCIAALTEKYTDFYFELLSEIEFNLEDVKKIISEDTVVS